MGSKGRVLLYNSLAVLIGVVAMIAVVRSVVPDSSKLQERMAARTVTSLALPKGNRPAFAPPAALSSPDPPTDDQEFRPSIAPNFDQWSTDVRPQITPRPSEPSQRTQTLKARLAEISPPAISRLTAKFEAAKAAWPPAQITFIAIKDEKILELHARQNGGAWTLVHRYRVLAASGAAGPKLRQGDRQVPEGVYGIEFLNPNSAYHVSLRVNYPNDFDRQMAVQDGRNDLGGDIMIHGKNLSAGCLAMGDEVVEELFVLAAQTGLSNVKLIIVPTDFRQNGLPAIEPKRPEWLPKLYADLANAISEFKAPRSGGLLSFFTK